ncbi:MAG: YhjD/YihY/BrkB family envelope integrity protein [Actinomycetota bacterium]
MRLIDDAIDRVDRIQRRRAVLAFPFAVVRKFSDDQAGRLAALTAYYAFFSMFPLLIVFITVLGILLRDNPHLQHSLEQSVLAQFPVIGTQIKHNIHSLSGGGVALVFSILATLWAGLGAIRAGQAAMDTVWDVPRKEQPTFLRRLFRSLAMLGVFGVFILLTTGLAGLATTGASFGAVAKVGGILGALALNFLVFALAFRVLTVARISWRDVVPGAIFAAVAWEALQLGGAYIVGHQIKNASQTYGTFAFVIALLSWIYLGAQVTLYGAEINVVRARRLWPRALRDQPRTEADEIALRRKAKQEERVDRETVDVRFRPKEDDPPEDLKPIGGGAMEQRTTEPVPAQRPGDQSTLQLVKSIASDTGTLVRKEVELAKQEILEAVSARLKAAGALGAAGAFGFLGLLFGCVAAVAGLSLVVATWLAALIVTGSLFAIAGLAAMTGLLRMKKPSMAPTETVRTVKEDVEWARAQLKR